MKPKQGDWIWDRFYLFWRASKCIISWSQAICAWTKALQLNTCSLSFFNKINTLFKRKNERHNSTYQACNGRDQKSRRHCWGRFWWRCIKAGFHIQWASKINKKIRNAIIFRQEGCFSWWVSKSTVQLGRQLKWQRIRQYWQWGWVKEQLHVLIDDLEGVRGNH